MILTDLSSVTAYRMHTPKWATAPTSGAGAATHGGRANRPGIQGPLPGARGGHGRTRVPTSLPVDAAGHPRELHGERQGRGRLPARLRLGGLVAIVGRVLLRLAGALVQPVSADPIVPVSSRSESAVFSLTSLSPVYFKEVLKHPSSCPRSCHSYEVGLPPVARRFTPSSG